MTDSDRTNKITETTQVVKPLSSRIFSGKGGWIIGLVCLMVLLLVVLLERMNAMSSSVAGLKKDVADSITLKVKDDKIIKTDVAALQKNLSALNKKVNDIMTVAESLIENVNALTDMVTALNNDMATKADKTALSRLATKSRLKRVEETLDVHLLVEAAKETIPLANDENKSAVGESEDDGTITVIIRPVPVDDEE